MKKCLFIVSLSLCILNAKDLQEGFGGKVFVGGGIRHIKSNITPFADNPYLSSYDDKHSKIAAVPIAGLELFYKELLGHDQIFLKNFNGRDLSGLAVGYEKRYIDYKTSIELVSSLREKAYANPYDTSIKREETTANKFGFKLSQAYHFNEASNLYISYLFAKNHIEKESVSYRNLRRKGLFHQFEFGYKHSFINANINYDFNDAKGKAESFTRYGLSLGIHIMPIQNYILSPNFSFNKYNNKGTNFIFNQKQDGDILKFGLSLSKLKFLDHEKLYAFASYNIHKKDSNINFYDETFQVFLLGLGYGF
ncbi:hypothetical protein DMB92_05165 [Campylobacter sp. MIT 99-7217]|uniref:DUF2860 family protein n=1 Tax=Campylobacter sp. MIT 99-7217 TaxID=535091 RepID=UPI001159A3E3|nr:DUF2860 family protein [Campylobacter sp. MIT 99-7217]TQR32487.1 hypothetical protein DMB92_05165 [Campylobacter sp. MIT 99-7217]